MIRWLPAVVLAGSAAVTMAVLRRDSYLNAYMDSHGPSSMPPGEVYASDFAGYNYPTKSYGVPAEPHAASEDNPLDPVHAKLVLLFKVLLKLLIFKLLVKFMAIICVFLFLPKLSGLGLAKEAAADAKRIARTGSVMEEDQEERLRVTQFVLDSLSSAPLVCPKDTLVCRLRRALVEVDSLTSIPRLFQIYKKEEEDRLQQGNLKTRSRR